MTRGFGSGRAKHAMWKNAAARGSAVAHAASGAQYLKRASAYYHVGERFLQPKSREGLDAYKRGVECFRDAAKYIKRPRLEHVEIPYEGASLPGVMFTPSRRTAWARCRPLCSLTVSMSPRDPVLQGRGRSGCARHRMPDRRRAGKWREHPLSRSLFAPRYRALCGAGRGNSLHPGPKSIRNALALWRSAWVDTTRRAQRHSSSVMHAASPGARSGTIRRSGAIGLIVWRGRHAISIRRRATYLVGSQCRVTR